MSISQQICFIHMRAHAKVIAASCLVIAGVTAYGCTSPDFQPSVLMERAADPATDPAIAYGQVAYVIITGNKTESARAIAMVKADSRLQSGMRERLKQVASETLRVFPAQQRFIPAYLNMNEVKAYFKLVELPVARQSEYAESAWRGAVDNERAEREAREAAQRAAQEELSALKREAVLGSRYTCMTDVRCKKAFSLAQIYVNTVADMKIQIATDTIIETYNATRADQISSRVIKIPGAGETAKLEFQAMCADCGRRALEAMRGFKPFIERSLDR